MRNAPMDDDRSAASRSSDPRLLPVANATVPYWRTQLHPIDEHRSTEKLPSTCDIAIIGAGLSGVSTAYHLAANAGSKTPSIVLLEARQVCSGATGRNGGHCKIKTDSLMNQTKQNGLAAANELAAFVNSQVYALKQTVERERLDCEFELRRSYDAFLDDDEAEAVRTHFEESLSQDHSWTRDRQLIVGDLAEQATSLKGVKVAVSSTVCSLWPYKFVTQLLAKLVAQDKVNLQTNTPVFAVSQDRKGHSIITTDRGSLRACKVIFATNAYTSGLCPLYENCITPYKGTASHITPKHGPVAPYLSNTYNISYNPGPGRTDYLNPRPDGGIVVGGGNWFYKHNKALWYKNWDDSVLLPGVKGHFDNLMQRHFNGWENSGAKVDHIWTGIQASTPDTLPHVGEVPGTQGQHYVLAGYNGGGNAFCFLCAKGVAEMVLNEVSYESTGLPKMFKTRKERLGFCRLST